MIKYIGIVDSGLGGYDIYQYLNKTIKENYLLYLDYKNNPYGSKSKEEHLKIIDQIITFLNNYKLKYLIIACNTLSNYLSYFKEKLKIPIIDIINPTIQYINKKYDLKKIKLLATKTTIDNKKYQKNLVAYIEPILIENLVSLIENNDINNIRIALNNHFINIKNNNILLGCTHYPIIKNEFKRLKPKKILDSRKALKYYLKHNFEIINYKKQIVIINKSDN